jgi:hypothetical protein
MSASFHERAAFPAAFPQMIALDAGFVGMHASLLSPTNTAAVAATAKATGGGGVG